MAVRHDKAGQFAKTQALKRLRQILALAVGFSLLGGAISGLLIAGLWVRHRPGVVIALAIGGVLLLVVFRKWIEPYVDRIAIDRIKYLRGGQTEALVAWLLEDLDDDWHVFNGIRLERNSDIDHVVVGPGGIYCVSTKSARGWFVGTPDGLLHNSKPSDLAQRALRQTMNLKDRLVALMGADVPWVQPVLAVPYGYVDGDACGGKVWLVHQEQIPDCFAPDGGPRRLDPHQVGRVVKVMEIIRAGAADVYERPAPNG